MTIDPTDPAASEESHSKLAADSESAVGGKAAGIAAQVKPARPAKREETWGEIFQTIVIALLIAGIVRSFLFQPFNIPSESMKPTLLVGDFLFVSKYSYGYSRYSLPFSLPLISGRILAAPPKRGDVVVFKTPADNRTDLIKRVIGLPGDEIQMRRGVLYINGAPVPRAPAGMFAATDPATGLQRTGTLYQETLPNGVTYKTLDLGDSPEDDTDVYKVPAGHYFMMGDNRDNSSDSRIPISMGGVGYVPLVNLVGKAQIFFFSFDTPKPAWAVWEWPGGIRIGRIFKPIR